MIEYNITKIENLFRHHLKSKYGEWSFDLRQKDKIDLDMWMNTTCLYCDSRRYKSDALICRNCRNDNNTLAEEQKSISKIRKIITNGYVSPFSKKEVHEKCKNSIKERYGVESVSQIPSVREKVRNTNLKKYGVENVSQSKKIKDKVRQTNLERYGSESFLSSKYARNKIEKTNLERYGGKSPASSGAIVKKIQKTNLERYGNINPMNIEEIQDKIKRKRIEKYGTYNLNLMPGVREKREKTNLKKYGVKEAFSSSEIQNKIKQTTLKKYGVEYPSQNKGIKTKISEAHQKKIYGGYTRNEIMKLWLDEYNMNGLNSAKEKYPQVSYLMYMKYALPDSEKKKGSTKELELNESFSSIDWETNVRSIVPGNKKKEIDLLNRKHKISIEFNGFYWHQIKNDKIKEDLCKAEAMRKIGYKHFALDETDMYNIDLLSSMIDPDKQKVYAKTCEVVQIDNPKDFLESYHLQGSISSEISYGLYHEDKLIQVMTFGKSRFDKLIEWEILRLCSHPEYMVVGGVERTFKAFLKYCYPKSIVSYSDNKYFDGKIYEKLGFEFVGNTSPNYVWFKRGISLGRHQTMKHKLPKILGEGFNPDLTEAQNMESNGWVKIKDLGNKKWLYHKENNI